MDLSNTPLSDLNYRFEDYVKNRKAMTEKHMDGNGLPDYAYKMDLEHRRHLDSVPGLLTFARKLSATVVPQQLRKHSMSGVAVGPNQYPEIYGMVRECGSVLGIGIPDLIIVPALFGDEFNACTFATGDTEPVILITGLMVERMSSDELKAIIAHECGHIHNQHSLYGTLENIISTIGLSGVLALPGIKQLAGILTQSTKLALDMWSRAAEVTADRAALICTGSAEVTSRALSKFMYNGADMTGTVDSELNLKALREQMEMTLDNPYRLGELLYDHPLTIKRVFAVMDFAECEKFYEWRPDLKSPDRKLRSKEETDRKCKKYIDVVMTKGQKGGKKK